MKALIGSLLISSSLLAVGAITDQASAAASFNTTCRIWENGKDTGIRGSCTVQFDNDGASVISTNGYHFVRGLNGIFPGYKNKECLRDMTTAICPIGNFGY